MQRDVIRIAGGVDAATQTFTYQRNARLKQIIMSVRATGVVATDDRFTITLELNPRGASPNDDTTEEFSATLAVVAQSFHISTNGGGVLGGAWRFPVDERIAIGDRLRIHLSEGGGGAYNIQAVLFTL